MIFHHFVLISRLKITKKYFVILISEERKNNLFLSIINWIQAQERTQLNPSLTDVMVDSPSKNKDCMIQVAGGGGVSLKINGLPSAFTKSVVKGHFLLTRWRRRFLQKRVCFLHLTHFRGGKKSQALRRLGLIIRHFLHHDYFETKEIFIL